MAKPAAVTVLVDVDYGSRGSAIIAATNAINLILAYGKGDNTLNATVPDASYSEQSIATGGIVMMNRCIASLNSLNTSASLGLTPLALRLGGDFNDWQVNWNRIITFANAVRTALP